MFHTVKFTNSKITCKTLHRIKFWPKAIYAWQMTDDKRVEYKLPPEVKRKIEGLLGDQQITLVLPFVACEKQDLKSWQ